ncbi:MAG: DUF2235 domain-containing protein [Acidobacteriaceae bacterium]|nr:DUF2235 domain-containing protein [Acidobacteriaceae bacterium]
MRIAHFCDGTWNDPANNTNVFRLFTATLQIPGQQHAAYDTGVGTGGNPIDKLLGGGLGAGLVTKIKDGYTQIAHVYDPGDDIFLFGFSRGAYTARSLAGMIAICGLPTQNLDQECVDTAFEAYRNQAQRSMLLDSLKSYAMDDAKIRMLGVWDTVGSLGIPAAWGGIDDVQYGFLDASLHPDVLNAYQALAIDEQRAQFPPTLWESPFAPGQTVEQVWFSGVHCDVGGGYSASAEDNNTLLSDITLGWMAGKASALGLAIDPAFLLNHSNLAARYSLDELHDSHTGVFLLTPPKPRTIPAGAVLSNSVLIRCQNAVGYAPGNLTLNTGVPDQTYSNMQTVLDAPVLSW